MSRQFSEYSFEVLSLLQEFVRNENITLSNVNYVTKFLLYLKRKLSAFNYIVGKNKATPFIFYPPQF